MSSIPSTEKTGTATSAHLDYLKNTRLFTEFHTLQEELVRQLSSHPSLIRAWLDSLPPRDDSNEGPPTASQSWRASRLSATRQRELSSLIAQAELAPGTNLPLADFLLKALPVSTYFKIADRNHPLLRPVTIELYRKLEASRSELFDANYGLAKSAVRGKKAYDELLSVASIGLLEAIDRYDPSDPKSSKFGYFANFWIRFQISRYGQKNGTTVALSINQQRIVRKIEHLLEERREAGLPVPSELEICTELKISPEAYYWYQQRPVMLSLDSICGEDEQGEPLPEVENLIASGEPKPNDELENAEIAEYLRELLRKNVSAHRRVMMSYARRVGNLGDAVEDYLEDLQTQAVDRVQRKAAAAKQSPQLIGRLSFVDDSNASSAA